MTSTVVDAALCLVLVSAAVVALADAPTAPPADAGRADAVAETLATSTAAVNYTLAPPRRADGDRDAAAGSRVDPPVVRTRHGSLAGLLADGAVGGLRIDGERPTRASDGFRRAVREAVAAALPVRGRVVASWRPYAGARVEGRLTVGPTPPADARVRAATLTVPSGTSAGNATAAARADGYRGVAALVAESLVDGLFPPRRTALALRDGPPTAAIVRHRYRRIASSFGAEPNGTLADGRGEAAADRLTAAAADATEADLRRRFDSPAAAAEAVEIDRVRIVVRTWAA